jgi:WD40 repeat protein
MNPYGNNTSSRVFLSYSRQDDSPNLPFLHRLYDDLKAAGFEVWFDRQSLLSRGLTFHQEIKDALRTEIDRVIYIGGPRAVASPHVREEWRTALEFDHVVVIPILRHGDFDTCIPAELAGLHCEDFRRDHRYPQALKRLIKSLRQPIPKLGTPVGVPSLPPHFLGRPGLFREVHDALAVHLQAPIPITGPGAKIGIHGMGGIGKSVLAAAVARNRAVRSYFPNGIFWVSLGQKVSEDDVLSRLREMVAHFKGETSFNSLLQGQGILFELLHGKSVLLVLDDVWSAEDAQAFDFVGPCCRTLVTTQDAGILRALGGKHFAVSLFSEQEAGKLLLETAGVKDTQLSKEARMVVGECGRLPLALSLCGGMARKRGGDFRSVLERLHRADLTKIADRTAINEQHRSIWTAMHASVEMLPSEERRLFLELGVFPTDQNMPFAAAEALWGHTGGKDDLDTEELLHDLHERSLVQLSNLENSDESVRDHFSLHDLLHNYARCSLPEYKKLQAQTIEAYREQCPEGWHTGPEDGYFFQNLLHHFIEAEDWSGAWEWLTSFPLLMRRCELGHLSFVLADFGRAVSVAPEEVRKRLGVWTAFFQEKAHILRRGGASWPTHRILLQLAVEHADNSPLTNAAEQWLAAENCDWVRLRSKRRLERVQSSPCLGVLEGHSGPVWGATVLADGRFMSWSEDGTLRFWNPHSGECLRTLVVNEFPVGGALALSPDRILAWGGGYLWGGVGRDGEFERAFQVQAGLLSGVLPLSGNRVLSWEMGGGLIIWDGISGERLAELVGHSRRIIGAQVLPDSRLLTWSEDSSLMLWDSETGDLFCELAGHSAGVLGATDLQDGHVLSWSRDSTLRIWESWKGNCLEVLEGHLDWVVGALQLPGGNLVSWSLDKTLRTWDLDSGHCIHSLAGHSDRVVGALPLSDDRLLSWSDDATIRMWALGRGECIRVLEGHNDRILGLKSMPGGRIISWSRDGTIRIWDETSGEGMGVLQGHYESVCDVLTLPDGRLLSWAGENTFRLWEAKGGEYPIASTNHEKKIQGALQVPGRGVLTWSSDGTLRRWDDRDGQCSLVYQGHTEGVVGAVVLSDRHLLSWSRDNMFKIWETESGCCLQSFDGHFDDVLFALPLPDGRILSGSKDSTLRLWDGLSGSCLAVLQGHQRQVEGALHLPDGRLLSWSWDASLRIWDGLSGDCLAVLGGSGGPVGGAMCLPDKRLLSWSLDGVLRIWDSASGDCLAEMKGHSGWVKGAALCSSGNILSWDDKGEYRLWDGSGQHCLGRGSEDRILDDCPGHHGGIDGGASRQGFYLNIDGSIVFVSHTAHRKGITCWHGESPLLRSLILENGSVGVVGEDRQVSILEFYRSKTRISLDEIVSFLGLPATPLPDQEAFKTSDDEEYLSLIRRGLSSTCRIDGEYGYRSFGYLSALAFHLERLGHTAEADRWRREVDRLRPEFENQQETLLAASFPDRLLDLALDALRQGELSLARQRFQELNKVEYKIPCTLFHLAEIALLQGDREQARNCLGLAWATRKNTPPEELARVVWLKLVLQVAGWVDDGSRAETLCWLKRILEDHRARSEGDRWITNLVLDTRHLDIDREDHDLLSRLLDVMKARSHRATLDRFAEWKNAEPITIE